MKTISKVALLLGLSMGVQVCTTVTQDKKDVVAVAKGNFKDFDLAYQGHEVSVQEGKTFQHPTGSKITIPANAFVDGAGKPIEGKVQINYREFHTATDIITAGITMQYDSAGVKQPFETAGMFEMRAAQAGKEVFLAKGKSVKVDLASYKDGAFNFYYLQEAKKTEKVAITGSFLISQAVAQDVRPGEDRWQLLQTSGLPTENQERKQQMADIEKKLPVVPAEPLPYDEKTPVFDLDIDTKDFPELRTFEGIVWQYAGDANDNSKNPAKNEWISEHNWSNIRLEIDGDMQYRLILTSATKTFESQVRPALKGVAFEKAKALFAQKKEEYEADLQKRADEISKLKAEKNYIDRIAKFTRSFNIQNMGIYNCDRIWEDPSAMTLVATFNTPDDPSATQLGEAQIYLIMGKDIINSSAQKGIVRNFRFSPKKDNKVVVLFKGSEKVSVLSAKDFKKLDFGKAKEGGELYIELKTISEKIKSTAALEELIAKL